MLLKLFLAFTLIPLVEIYLLIKLGQNFGAITSILLVIFTGILGAYLPGWRGCGLCSVSRKLCGKEGCPEKN